MPKGYPMTQQITEVKKGDRLEFIRPVTVDGIRLAGGKGKRVDVIAAYDEAVLLAFSKPVRDTTNTPVRMVNIMGFKYCYLVNAALLITNCKKV